MMMTGLTKLLGGLLLIIKESVRVTAVVQCAKVQQLQTTSGQDVWYLRSNLTGSYPPLCEWELHPPDNEHITNIQIFNLFLKTPSSDCSAYLIINGEKLCSRPKERCRLYQTQDASEACRAEVESEKYFGCSRHVWQNPSSKMQLKSVLKEIPNAEYQYINLVYTYINCAVKGKSSGRKAGPMTPKPKATATGTTSATIQPSSNLMYTAVIPVAVALVFIIIILLVIICRKRCRKKEAPYEYAGRNGITILPDATDADYETVDFRYEAIKDIHPDKRAHVDLKKNAKNEREIVDNILYEKEVPRFFSADNASYELTLDSRKMKQ